MEKITKWKAGMEEMGLRVNIGKTKVMRCCVGAGSVIKSGKDPCGVCNKGVGSNSIKCTSCKAWIHKRCSGISGKLQVEGDFRCKTCANGPVEMERQEEISLGVDSGEKLDCVEKFCYFAT